jgi:G-protein coupled receptor 98
VDFLNGENERKILLTIVQDSLPEPAESFDVHLMPDTVTGQAVVRGILMAKLIIEDSDNVYGNVEFGPDTNHFIDIVSIVHLDSHACHSRRSAICL